MPCQKTSVYKKPEQDCVGEEERVSVEDGTTKENEKERKDKVLSILSCVGTLSMRERDVIAEKGYICGEEGKLWEKREQQGDNRERWGKHEQNRILR